MVRNDFDHQKKYQDLFFIENKIKYFFQHSYLERLYKNIEFAVTLRKRLSKSAMLDRFETIVYFESNNSRKFTLSPTYNSSSCDCSYYLKYAVLP